MRVQIIAQTKFDGDNATSLTDYVWDPDITGSDAANLAEFAGRVCYGSFDRPNPKTASNEGYLDHVLDVGHYTLVEHGSVTFYVDGVSRSLTHEMIRHRHNSYSQLSQRFVLQGQGQSNGRDPFVTPPLFQDSVEAGEILWTAWADAMEHYERLVTLALEKIPGTPGSGTPTSRKKEAREAARCVLPNMTPTAIVITGNHSAWRDFLTKRGSLHADAEIRQFALLVFNALRFEEPNIYQDFRVKVDDRNRSYLVRDAQD